MSPHLLFLLFVALVNTTPMPTVLLQNAASEDSNMPAVRLGTFGYFPYGCNPENWRNGSAYNATLSWFESGGIGWDSAFGYLSKQDVANGILKATNSYTTTSRDKIWITTKVGGDSGCEMGYNDVMVQFRSLLQMFQTTYFDLVLIHWPSCGSGGTSQSTDPVCRNENTKEYNPSLCRQHTWNALMDLYKNGSAKAIGVSNFEQKHLSDIIGMNSLLPAVNQFEFHGYWHEFGLVNFCQKYNITVNSYAPLGTPDVECNGYNKWPYTLPQNPIAIKIGNNYKKTGAQVWLRWAWQQNVVLNPRTMNVEHMKENMNIFDFELTSDEMQQLSSANSTAPKYPKDKVCPDPNVYQ